VCASEFVTLMYIDIARHHFQQCLCIETSKMFLQKTLFENVRNHELSPTLAVEFDIRWV